jgi:hypothetical protein
MELCLHVATANRTNAGREVEETTGETVIRISVGSVAVKRLSIVRVQVQAVFDSFGQIGVGDEEASEGNQIRIARFDDLLRTVGVKAASRDGCALVDLTKSSGSHRRESIFDFGVTVDPGLNRCK